MVVSITVTTLLRCIDFSGCSFAGASETMISSTAVPTPVAASNIDSITTTTAKAKAAAATTTAKAKAKRAVGDFVLPVQTAEPEQRRSMHKRHQRGPAAAQQS